MKEIILDGKKIDTVDELHAFFKKELNFPDYYGMNLNAFWDCLTGYIALPIKIVWKNFELSKNKLGEEFVGYLIRLFERAKKELAGEFDYELR